MATASLVLGILSILCGTIGIGMQPGGIVLAVIGIVLSKKNKEADKAATAKAGKVCCVIGLIHCLVTLTVSIIFVGIFHTIVGAELLEELLNYLRQIL